MLAHHGLHGDGFGRSEGGFPPKYLSLEQIQLLPRRHSTASSKRASRSHKLRILTSPVAPAYCPSTTVAPTPRPKKTKSIRPKLEQPPSPAMSGYSYSSSDQGNYGYQTPYQTGVPQYTQSQINAYYAQYQCYPAQPYQIVPDYYVQPTIQQPEYAQPVGAYDTGSWQTQDIPTSQGPTRSTSRTKTWTCDIHGCTSSANFTRLADLQRHQSTVHGMGTPEFPCSMPRCNRVGDKGFTRRDHLVEHLRNFHHIDIPKRRPGERSAFPFGWPEGGGGVGGGAQFASTAAAAAAAPEGEEEMAGHGGGAAASQSVRGLRSFQGQHSHISRSRSSQNLRGYTASEPGAAQRRVHGGHIAKPQSRRGRAGSRSRGGSRSTTGMTRLIASSASSLLEELGYDFHLALGFNNGGGGGGGDGGLHPTLALSHQQQQQHQLQLQRLQHPLDPTHMEQALFATSASTRQPLSRGGGDFDSPAPEPADAADVS